MDTSKAYIAQCDCPEIQELWDDVSLGKSVGNNFSVDDIWLPRQDQFQEMLDDVFSNREIVPLICKLKDFLIGSIQAHQFKGNTMEQLWLAFVMREKFSKSWNGKEWI